MKNCLHAFTYMAFRVTYYAGLETFVGRSHQTKVGLCLSDVVALLSGVIQGSGIGSVMFLIYILMT